MYWDLYAAVKFTAAIALVFGLSWMWDTRDDVVGAYTNERSVQALEIEPLSFSAATIPPEELDGAMKLAVAPDTGSVGIEPLAFLDPVVASPAIRGGSAELSGTVVGLAPEDVGEVRLTRITDGGQREIRVPIEEDRSWTASGIHGGRYRVRALVPGLRASNGSEVLFLDEDAERSLQLRVSTPPQGLIFDVVATEGPQVGGQSVVAVTVGRQLVDTDGRSVVSPVVGTPVTATFSPVVSLLSAGTVPSSGQGAVRFLVRCDLVGRSAVTISAEGQNTVLTIPACEPVPVPEPSEDSPAVEQGSSDG